jgi:putative Holliday junction resolvase
MANPLDIIDNERVFDANKVQQGTVLAFDFGEQRIGIAVGEHLIKAASPLMQIDEESNEIRFQIINQLVKEWHPTLLVVGLPLNLEGEETAICQLCRKFARRLNGRFNLPVILIDERYSSAEAENLLAEQGIKGRNQKEKLDQMAAATILQQYFDQL